MLGFLLRRKKGSRHIRNVVMALLVGAAALFGVVYFFELPRAQILSLFLASLAFVVGVMILAVGTTLAFKALSRLFRK